MVILKTSNELYCLVFNLCLYSKFSPTMYRNNDNNKVEIF